MEDNQNRQKTDSKLRCSQPRTSEKQGKFNNVWSRRGFAPYHQQKPDQQIPTTEQKASSLHVTTLILVCKAKITCNTWWKLLKPKKKHKTKQNKKHHARYLVFWVREQQNSLAKNSRILIVLVLILDPHEPDFLNVPSEIQNKKVDRRDRDLEYDHKVCIQKKIEKGTIINNNNNTFTKETSSCNVKLILIR